MIEIILGCVAGVFALTTIAFATLFFLAKKREKERSDKTQAPKVKVVDGVRYSVDKSIVDDRGDKKVSHLEGDITLERGKEYTVRRGGHIMPGKYTALAAGSDGSFNMRIGGFVRTYSHSDGIVLSEGDKITATSHTVVLR